MFNMINTGRTISTLRKEHNLTQMELAEKLGISFQAISSWERGETMPDISKLPELSYIFGVTIDILLGNQNQEQINILNKIIEGKPEEIIDDNLKCNIAEVAPILKPKQIDMLVKKIEKVSIGELTGLAPFISQETLDKLVENAVCDGNIGEITRLAPFLSEQVVDKLAGNAVCENDVE